MQFSLDEQNKILDQVRQKAKEDETILEAFDEYEISPDEINYIPMCFSDLDVSARTMHAVIYFNLKLLEDPNPLEKVTEYFSHEVLHFLQQTTGDGPTEGSSDDQSYLDNENEVEGFNFQTKYISRNESPEKAEEYVEKVLEHHDIPESEKEEKKDDLLRTAGIFQDLKNKFLNKEDQKLPPQCVACQRFFGSPEDHQLPQVVAKQYIYPLKSTLKIRGKDVCVDCYSKMIRYRNTIPCVCGHSKSDHGFYYPADKNKCYADIERSENYRSPSKKCSCENYKPSQDDYSDANDGKQLSLEFEKPDISSVRKENIQELKDRVMHEIETGEEFKRKEKYRKRPSLNLIRKEHPYARKNIADLARKVMEATEKKDDNLLDDSDRCSCSHLKTDHAPKIGLCFMCEHCNGYSNENESEFKINNIVDQKCSNCNHLRHQHLNDSSCQEFIGGSYRSRPQQCFCEKYV